MGVPTVMVRFQGEWHGTSSDADKAWAFADWLRKGLGPGMPEGLFGTYAFASGFSDSWWELDLLRFWSPALAKIPSAPGLRT